MNPTPQKIEAVFALNSPDHYYWTNLQKFMNGHSQKAREELMRKSLAPELKGLLLGMMHGLTAKEWYAAGPEDRNRKTMSFLRIMNNMNVNTGELYPLTEVKFDTLGKLWATLSPPKRNAIWCMHWSYGIEADDVGTAFMHRSMQDWKPTSVQEAQWKVLTLLDTLFQLREEMGTASSSLSTTKHFKHYSGLLTTELESVKGRWPVDGFSVQIWSGLLQMPDFQEQVGFEHPWMLSLCQAYQCDKKSVLEPPQYSRFKEDKFGGVTLLDTSAPQLINPYNPLDHLLAKALQSMGSPNPVIAPEVQGLAGMMEGTDDLLGAVFCLEPPGYVHPEVDAGLFSSPI